MCFFFFFFFSSRRRHTRCLSDWSSDVCSSDLSTVVMASPRVWDWGGAMRLPLHTAKLHAAPENATSGEAMPEKWQRGAIGRSEERRVGKECRSRRSPYE